MYWTLELASYLSDAPWPANKDELIDFAFERVLHLKLSKTFKPLRMKEKVYESIDEIWPDYPTDDDYLWNEDEY